MIKYPEICRDILLDMYRFLALLNKLLLPSFTKQRLDLAKAPNWKKAIIAYRYWVTCKALDESNK